MPYATEHAARIKSPSSFQAGSFRRKTIASGIDVIMGKLNGKTSMTTQAYRFKKSRFTVAQAKKMAKRPQYNIYKFWGSKELIW